MKGTLQKNSNGEWYVTYFRPSLIKSPFQVFPVFIEESQPATVLIEGKEVEFELVDETHAKLIYEEWDTKPGFVEKRMEQMSQIVIKTQQELINLYENQIMDLTAMSKIELGDDVIAEIKRLKEKLNDKIN